MHGLKIAVYFNMKKLVLKMLFAKIILSVFFVNIIFSSQNLLAGGWTSTGGGSGVACFKTENFAKKADLFITKNQPFDEELFNNIESVELLDLFKASIEAKKLITQEWSPNNHNYAQWSDLYHSLSYRIKTLAPLFGLSLEVLDSKMNFETWKPVSQLILLKDQYLPTDSKNINIGKEIALSHPRCRLIQVVTRNSMAPHKSATIYSNSFPLPDSFFAFEIQYIKPLFDKMDFLNQALLYLHEQLYLMGTPIGHLSSDDTRYWVREFALLKYKNIYLSESSKFLPPDDRQFDSKCKESEEGQHCFKPPRFIRMRMTQTFGDYVLYFYKEVTLKKDSIVKNPFYSLFIKSLLKSRHELGVCLGKTHLESKKQQCFEDLLNLIFSNKDLTGPENLLYLSWYIYENELKLFNYEYLVNPDLSLDFALQWLDTLKFLCHKVQEDNITKPYFNELLIRKIAQADFYCKDYLKLPRK
jgi:hypothetical protein